MARRAITPAPPVPASCYPASPCSCFPCFPAPCFLLPALCTPRRSEPRGQFLYAADGAVSGPGWWGGVPGVGYPQDMPKGHVLGGYTTTGTPPTPLVRCPHRQRRTGTALWAQRARRVRVASRAIGLWPMALQYLRLFSPGQRIQPESGFTNDWIGSRSEPARGRLSVQDLVGLSLTRGSGRSAGRDGREGRDGRDGREATELTSGAA